MSRFIRVFLTIIAITINVNLILAKPLIPFKSCNALQSYMIKNAVKRVGPYGLGSNPIFFRTDSPILFFASSGSGPQNAPAPPIEGSDFSGTNVQVSGVDEPDIVKTDGKRVFAIRDNSFYYVDSKRSGTDGNVIAKLELPSYGREMLFDKNDVIVISQVFDNLPVDRISLQESFPLTTSRQSSSSLISRPFPSFSQEYTVLYRINVKGRSLKLMETLRIPGRYVSGRSVDGIARIVLTYDGSKTIPFIYPNGKTTSKKATLINRQLIRRTKFARWLPKYSTKGTYCRTFQKRTFCQKFNYSKIISSCKNVYYPKGEFSGFNLLNVVTIRLSGPMVPRGASIVADGDTVYSTAKSLYVATTEYEFDFTSSDSGRLGRFFSSSFHKFSLNSFSVKYEASGEVSGSVLNQFAMHEYNDIFFVATTDGAPWWGSRDTTSSKVSAFKASEGTLVKKSEVGNLGIGERIYAVRYITDTAYVVTFRQVDPLYIIDLSNISKLRVTGELKIPGYSAYLHPIKPGRILGVGREATPEGRTTGSKISLFDVSDVTNPKELSSWTLKGSYSSAEWDHRAFLYWAPENIAVLPLSIYSNKEKESFYGSIILNVADTSISERGRISHTCCGLDYQKTVARNFVLGKNYLWSLSSQALQINNIKSLQFKSNIPLTSNLEEE